MSSPKRHKGTSSTRNLRSFSHFPRLPPELRRQVWKHACFHPRDVDLTASFEAHTLVTKHEGIPTKFHYLSICPPPALLSVNNESRSEGLKWYTLDFGSRSLNPLSPTSPSAGEGKPHIYMNWTVDRICLVNWGLLTSYWHRHAGLDFKERCKRNGLRRLACNLQGFYFERSVREFLKNGVDVQEVSFFHSSVLLYDECSGMRRGWRLQDRRMNQVGAYEQILGFVLADRKAREEAKHLEKDDGWGGRSVVPLEVKLVRFVQ